MKILNDLKVVCTRHSDSEHLWLKHHDPLDIGWFENTSHKAARGWWKIWQPGMHSYDAAPGRVGEQFNNYLHSLGQLVQCPIAMDRTDGNEFNQYNYHVDPIPKVESGWNRSIEELFLERAEEIWAMDKPVRLWWSGGIDSTTALIAFLRTRKPEHELIIYYNGYSIEENPHFWSMLKKIDDIKFESSLSKDFFKFSNFSDGTINVTGEPGDPFYGTFVVQNHIEDLDKHWTDIFNWPDIQYMFPNNGKYMTAHQPKGEPPCDPAKALDFHRPRFIEFCERFNAKCPFEIRNPFDFTWWIAFATKWQWIETRMFAQMPNPSEWQNMIGFYNSQEIQKWSIHNHDLKHKGTWKSYKWPSKDFIYEYDGNADYRDNKTKEKSINKVWNMGGSVGKSPFFNHLVMTDGSYHKKNDNSSWPQHSDSSWVMNNRDYDGSINLYDKWDIYNRPVWEEWKTQLDRQ